METHELLEGISHSNHNTGLSTLIRVLAPA